MSWTAYQVVFKLRSPLHIGCGKVGNLQRTRPYITGRVFWGGLTMRLTRDCLKDSPATDSKQYQEDGQKVHDKLAFTYFYPALQSNGNYEVQWPWENESRFRYRFLSSYASTALTYPQQAADEGSLHEVEFISPRTLDNGDQVYLMGYVFQKTDAELKWKEACAWMQIGGERGYGWGDLQCVKCSEIETETRLFDFNSNYSWQVQNNSVIIGVSEGSSLLAHTATDNVSAEGEIEPLVGREWRSREAKNRYAGQYVSYGGMYWVPGSQAEGSFKINNFGIWHLIG